MDIGVIIAAVISAVGAVLAAALSAVITAYFTLRWKDREDGISREQLINIIKLYDRRSPQRQRQRQRTTSGLLPTETDLNLPPQGPSSSTRYLGVIPLEGTTESTDNDHSIFQPLISQPQLQEGQQLRTNTPSVVKGVYWFSYSGMGAADIDATLYTHIFCAFAELDHNTNEVTISNGINAPHISSFTSTFQRSNPSVSTILSIEEGNYSTMARSSDSRQSFINSAIQLARDNNFCGLDINWQYPAGTVGMANYDSLLRELRTAVNDEAISSGRARLLLTAVLYFSARRERDTFPVESIKTNLDWINLMTYDYHGPSWEPRVTAAPAALYDPKSKYNTKSGIDCWISMGLPPTKIALGLPSYGRAWKLVNPIINGLGVGVAADGPAVGNEIEPNGAIAYIDIKNFINNKKATKRFDPSVVSNYCYADKTWIGYDDVESVKRKVEFAKDKRLLGYIFWSVSEDDENFSLSRAASDALG